MILVYNLRIRLQEKTYAATDLIKCVCCSFPVPARFCNTFWVRQGANKLSRIPQSMKAFIYSTFSSSFRSKICCEISYRGYYCNMCLQRMLTGDHCTAICKQEVTGRQYCCKIVKLCIIRIHQLLSHQMKRSGGNWVTIATLVLIVEQKCVSTNI